MVTVTTAAKVLTDYYREAVRQMAASTPQMRELAREAKQSAAYVVGISPKQVRYMGDQLARFEFARYAHVPVQAGDSRLMTSVDVALVGIVLLLRLTGLSMGLRFWTGFAQHVSHIRKGLRDQASGVAIRVDVEGRVSVHRSAEIAHEQGVWMADLGETRADVDRLIAKHRQGQSWEWVGWRRTPAKELRAMS